MSDQTPWASFVERDKVAGLLSAAMDHAAAGLSQMVGRPISIKIPSIQVVPIGQVAEHAGGAETEMVGVYLLIEGDVPAQAILMISQDDALHLVDLLMDIPEGSTTELGELEKSALGEVGNLTVSLFLNEIATLTGSSSKPSPPAVMIDMLGAIVNVVTTPIAATADDLLILETEFREDARVVNVHFWVMPYPVAEEMVNA